jgi:tetratricopeptide (TPR) repeat protein
VSLNQIEGDFVRYKSRKYGYNRIAFGEWLARNRRERGWSYRRLSQELFTRAGVLIHAGTLLHVERGNRSLPEAQRHALERIIPHAAPPARLHIERMRDLTPPRQRGAPADSGALMERWDTSRDRFLALALEAGRREDWSRWAHNASEAAMLDLTMGRLGSAARLLDRVIVVDARLIGRETLAQAYVDRGWLAMEQSRFADAARYLRRGEQLLQAGGLETERVFHFLGRVYSAWGIVNDDETMRELGRNYLTRALERDHHQGNVSEMGYDLLQQVPSLIYDDPRRAVTYLLRSKELLGLSGTPLGHHHLNFGRLEAGVTPAKAREHFERARDAYSQGLFYRKGLGSALRSLSDLREDDRETLPQAASYALVAALIHPYRQSLDRIERVATQVYVRLCDSRERRFVAFWRGQGERVARMSEDPFTLLSGLVETVGGSASLQAAMALAERAIRQGAPDWLKLSQPLLTP